ncbi:transcription factor E2F [Cryptosporidium bovis]|uniref:transcription factor E2F n=1 Tax=Cryptosporidium bovis TaxID=310047 RepID=UPI00351A87E5|nr:transcription factor E2F [Cryptosporidium bovis]
MSSSRSNSPYDSHKNAYDLDGDRRRGPDFDMHRDNEMEYDRGRRRDYNNNRDRRDSRKNEYFRKQKYRDDGNIDRTKYEQSGNRWERDNEKDRVKDRDRERDRDRDRERDRDRDRERDRDRDRERDRERDRDRDRERDRDRDRDRDRERDRDRDRDRDRERDRDVDIDIDRDCERRREREKGDKERGDRDTGNRERGRERYRERDRDHRDRGYTGRRKSHYRSSRRRSYSISSDESESPVRGNRGRNSRKCARSVSGSSYVSTSSYSEEESRDRGRNRGRDRDRDYHKRSRHYYSSDESSPERYRSKYSRYSKKHRQYSESESSSDSEIDRSKQKRQQNANNTSNEEYSWKGNLRYSPDNQKEENQNLKKWQAHENIASIEGSGTNYTPNVDIKGGSKKDSDPSQSRDIALPNLDDKRENLTSVTLSERLIEIRNMNEPQRCSKSTAKLLDLILDDTEEFLAEDTGGRELTKQQFVTWFVINQQSGPSIIESEVVSRVEDKRQKLVQVNKRLFTEISNNESYSLDFEELKDKETNETITTQIVLYGSKYGRLVRVYVIKDKDQITLKENISLGKLKNYKIFAIFLRYLRKKGIKYSSDRNGEDNSNENFDGVFHFYDFISNPDIIE